MSTQLQSPQLPWLMPNQEYPSVSQAWGESTPAPGLLAAGGALDVSNLCRAYRAGIFPWFSDGQPILWWSPDPRMVLNVDDFRVHPSFKKTIKKFITTAGCEIRIDSAFERVIQACSSSPRDGQAGTWIVPTMITAYCAMHQAGYAHSIETWVEGELVGGLYCIALGRSVFGESMFSRASDASKIALAALVAFSRHHGIHQIDCQQNTQHLASLGAREISKEIFLKRVSEGLKEPAPEWRFDALYWQEVLT